MTRLVILTLWITGLAVGAIGQAAEAGIFFNRPRDAEGRPQKISEGPRLFRHEEGTPPPGRPRPFLVHTHERAGYPLSISSLAHPTEGPALGGSYVGGGSACGNQPRTFEEGTFGWDYEGLYIPRRIWLAWSHGRRYQGGTGAYRTEGDRHIPDPIATTVSKIYSFGEEESTTVP